MLGSPVGAVCMFGQRDCLCYNGECAIEVVIIWESLSTAIFSFIEDSSNLRRVCLTFLWHECTLSCYITWHHYMVIITNCCVVHGLWPRGLFPALQYSILKSHSSFYILCENIQMLPIFITIFGSSGA